MRSAMQAADDSGMPVRAERESGGEGHTSGYESETAGAKAQECARTMTFEDLKVDPRLVRAAVSRMGFVCPTKVQQIVIPYLHHETTKHAIIKATTGSGKTVAYLIPLLERLLKAATARSRGLVIVPTEELVSQVTRTLRRLTAFCAKTIVIGQHVVVCSPTNWKEQMRCGEGLVLRWVVIDEFDIIKTLGMQSDLESLINSFKGQAPQLVCVSATPPSNVPILESPELLEVSDKAPIKHTYITLSSDLDKLMYLNFSVKMGLVKGRVLVFVNDISRAYMVQIFLKQFGIITSVLNAELPKMTRIQCLKRFNDGFYRVLVAVDSAVGSEDSTLEACPADDTPSSRPKRRRTEEDQGAYNCARGIDYHQVQAVIHFDLPSTVSEYEHRSGRTARGVSEGLSLAFIRHSNNGVKIPDEGSVEWMEKWGRDWTRFCDIWRHLQGQGINLEPQPFPTQSIDATRYRSEGAFALCSPSAIRLVRMQEIQEAILKCEKLRAHFAENRKDLEYIKADLAKKRHRGQRRLGALPEYLVPPQFRGINGKEKAELDGDAEGNQNGPGKRRKRPNKARKKAK